MEQALFDIILKAVMARVVTALPFLALPFLNPLVKYVVEKLLKVIYEEATFHVAFFTIKQQVEQEQKQYEEAVLKLKQAMAKQDEKEIQHAAQLLKEKLAQLINLSKPKP